MSCCFCPWGNEIPGRIRETYSNIQAAPNGSAVADIAAADDPDTQNRDAACGSVLTPQERFYVALGMAHPLYPVPLPDSLFASGSTSGGQPD